MDYNLTNSNVETKFVSNKFVLYRVVKEIVCIGFVYDMSF